MTPFFPSLICDGGLYQWSLLDVKGNRLVTLASNRCRITWKAPDQGLFTVIVRYVDRHTVIFEVKKRFVVRDFWMVSIGDSFSSGEGNPHQNVRKKLWLSRRCHSSRNSFAYKLYQKYKRMISDDVAVHFTFLPCSGALIEDGPFSLFYQIEAITNITMMLNKTPDLLLMTAGGNDIGYSDMLQRLLSGLHPVPDNFSLRLLYLSEQFDQLNKLIKGLSPSNVIIPHYFDFTTNEKGLVDASCSDFDKVSLKYLKRAQKVILRNLNNLIERKTQNFGWISVDLDQIFKKHGICSRQPLIRTLQESYRLQGDYGGSFHPTERAHQLIADLIFPISNPKNILNKHG
ncbi:unnamed protein product [Bursaphelenchus xylophilus]|uniref:(pine wood nematode) hypothetical protein n=1 Tax=Bursaphelenchus xylophilus TaxID=6326 RepID=A0A7I8X6Z2_BURXY|nr:unnamed protein product [Bursaphelenchus xylophilus]CAG9123229.1 unnamed protein product [Bursaphelenchus xylophilus]